MKKILLAVMAVILCLSFVGCKKGWTSSITDYSGDVSSNGGFLVEKGDYVYFINGKSDNTQSNSFGTPVKGAIVRVKKADIGKNVEAEVVVPEMVYSTQMANSNGIFIFGDYIYYATPCAEKDSKGKVRNTELEYMKTKLDCSETSVIATIASTTSDYRFVEIGGKVYLALNCTNSDSENVLRVYDTESNNKIIKETEIVTDYMFSTELNGEYAYYSSPIHNETIDEDESFNALRRIKLDGSVDEEVLNGSGTLTSAGGIGIAGVTFSPVEYSNGYVYISETTVQTSAIVNYKAVKEADVTATVADNYKKLVTIDEGSSIAEMVFAETSQYITPEKILYFDSTYGIMIYNYNEKSSPSLGRTQVYYNKDLLSYTLKFIKDGVAYFSDSTYYYSFNLSEVVDLTSGAIKTGSPEIKKLTFTATDSAWYLPEIVGNNLLTLVSDDGYYSYVYAFDMTVTDGKTEKEISDYSTEINKANRETVEKKHNLLVGAMSKADKDAYKKFLDENYPND